MSAPIVAASFAQLVVPSNGDTIETIDGVDMTSPDKALELYTRLHSAAQLTVRIVRRGQPLTLTYEIR